MCSSIFCSTWFRSGRTFWYHHRNHNLILSYYKSIFWEKKINFGRKKSFWSGKMFYKESISLNSNSKVINQEPKNVLRQLVLQQMVVSPRFQNFGKSFQSPIFEKRWQNLHNPIEIDSFLSIKNSFKFGIFCNLEEIRQWTNLCQGYRRRRARFSC